MFEGRSKQKTAVSPVALVAPLSQYVSETLVPERSKETARVNSVSCVVRQVSIQVLVELDGHSFGEVSQWKAFKVHFFEFLPSKFKLKSVTSLLLGFETYIESRTVFRA